MNRFIFGHGWVYEEEAGDGTEGGAGGGGETVEGETGDEGAAAVDDAEAVGDAGAAGKSDGAGAGEQPAAKKDEAPKDMLAAIDAGLGYKKGPKGEALDPLTGKVKEAPATKPGEKKPAVAADDNHPNGKPKKNDKGEDLDAEGKVVVKQTPKIKTAAELDMKPEERKLLGTKAQIRFGELINTVKAHEATAAKNSDTIKTLSEARDSLLGVMQETNTTPDQLSGYLEFNALLQSRDPKDLQTALGIVENQRLALYKALGKEPEGGGIDLLKDFPDLAKLVDEEEITRAVAVELATARREKAASAEAEKRAASQRQSKQQTVEQQKKESEDALGAIEAWTAQVSKGDLDYKAKESKLLDQLDGVMKEYPPRLWLPTLKRLYAGIVITKAPAPSGGHRPLRPSGAKPGDKAPVSMKEAIDQGLGYVGAGKG